MKTNYTSKDVQNPSAHITIRKGRVKIYEKEKLPTVYLQGGQEFEIELFNGTTTTQLAKIEINGKLISQGGIVLKSGERVYLERYLDIAKKFQFETYEVEAGNSIVEKAIVNNGSIKIQFFVESINTIKAKSNNIWNNNFTWTTNNGGYVYGSNTGTITLDGLADTNSLGLGGITYGSNTIPLNHVFTTTELGSINIGATYTTTSSSVTLDSFSDNVEPYDAPTMKETGIISEGSSSDQKFVDVNMNFSNYANTTIEYKILPLSEKIVEVKDIKNYCGRCKFSLKYNYNYCPQCGEKTDE